MGGLVSGKLEQHSSLFAYILAFKRVLWKEGFHSCTKTVDQLLAFKEETSIHRGPGPHPRTAAAEPALELGPDSGSFYNTAQPQLLGHRPEKRHTSGTTQLYPGPALPLSPF